MICSLLVLISLSSCLTTVPHFKKSHEAGGSGFSRKPLSHYNPPGSSQSITPSGLAKPGGGATSALPTGEQGAPPQ